MPEEIWRRMSPFQLVLARLRTITRYQVTLSPRFFFRGTELIQGSGYNSYSLSTSQSIPAFILQNIQQAEAAQTDRIDFIRSQLGDDGGDVRVFRSDETEGGFRRVFNAYYAWQWTDRFIIHPNDQTSEEAVTERLIAQGRGVAPTVDGLELQFYLREWLYEGILGLTSDPIPNYRITSSEPYIEGVTPRYLD